MPEAAATAPSRGAAPRPRLAGPAAVVAALLVVMALVAAAHWPVLRAQATSLDDAEFIKNNALVTHPGWATTSRFFREVLHPSSVRGYYLPLSMTSLMVDYALGGRYDDLRVFHRTSLALHLLTTALLVLLIYRLFGALLPAAIAGLLFGLHPLTVEPIAWVGERKTVLAAFFALAALLAYVESVRARGSAWRAVSLACFLLALLSKPTVTMLPLLLLVLDWWPLGRLSARAVLEKWPFFLVAIASAVITLISHERAAVIAPQSAQGVTLWPLRAAYLLAFYAGKILVPVNLTCVYRTPDPFALSNPVVAMGVATVVTLAMALLVLARRTRAPLAGAVFFALAIVPTLGLVKYSWVVASDKYVYFPAAGLLIAITAGLVAWGARQRAPAAWVPALALVFLLGAETYGVRITLQHWKDTPTLFQYMDRVTPDAPAVKNGLALIAFSEAKPDLAIRYLRESIALMPDFSDTRYNLAILLAERGETREAIEHLRRADALQPNDYEILGVLGATLREAGNTAEAIECLRRAVSIKPDLEPALLSLGQALTNEGRPGEGSEYLRRAVACVPDDPAVRYEFAAALLQVRGKAAESIAELRRVIEQKPDWAPPLNTLAWLLATSPDSLLRNPAEAKRVAERAVELTGRRRPEVLDTYAVALAAGGDFVGAIAVADSAIRLARQGHADALAVEIGTRLALYRRHRAYVSPPPAAGDSS